MSPAFWMLMVVGLVAYVALLVSAVRKERRRERYFQAMRSQAVFLRRLQELRALHEAETPSPSRVAIVGPDDAAIAEELIRQTAPHRGSRA